MASDPIATDENKLLDELRNRVRGWLAADPTARKQSALATDSGVNAADLVHFLNGERSLPTFALANLASILEMNVADLLLRWELIQYARGMTKSRTDERSQLADKKIEGWERAVTSLQSVLKRLPASTTAAVPPRAVGTLLDWPDAFQPLVVFVADRREIPPSSTADLLAVSGSPGDLFYLPMLGLPANTEIRSDKTCVVATPENLRAMVEDKNLLIIGSPAANLVAREVNPGACFSFYVTAEALKQSLEFKRLLEPYRYLPEKLKRYAGDGETPEEQEWSRRRRHMIYGFARGGILDPVDFEGPRANYIPARADYGVVSLCRHPWSDRRVAIVVAGTHGPATAAAVKLLAKENAFANHPLGGVFSVSVPTEAPWEERYHHLEPQWDTHAYTIDRYADALKTFVTKHEVELRTSLRFWDPSKVDALLKLLGATGDNTKS